MLGDADAVKKCASAPPCWPCWAAAQLRRETPMSAPDEIVCSYCGSGPHEVEKLLAGPSIAICSRCVVGGI